MRLLFLKLTCNFNLKRPFATEDGEIICEQIHVCKENI